MKYFINIEAKDGSYTCLLREIESSKSYPEFSVGLSPDDSVQIKEQSVSLAALIKKLADYQPEDLSHFFDDRGQLQIGCYLFNQIFKPLRDSDRTALINAEVEVRIVTKNEHIAKLPWSLLAYEELFLTTGKWSVALSPPCEECADCLLPPSPRLLFICPQPRSWGDTEAEPHIEELKTLLATANHLYTQEKYLRIVNTWSDLVSALESFKPHVVYYYGHGAADANSSRLVFSTSDRSKADIRPVADFANLLRSLQNDHPIVVYVNCCKGDVGGLLGVTFQLGAFIPAVITNCTIALVDAAREQGRHIWKNILVNGVAPHEAFSGMRRRLAAANFSVSDVRWITPVLHYSYKKWEFKAPTNISRLQLKPNWDNMLDRTRQTAEVIYRVGLMLRSQKSASVAFLWHGNEGEGIDQFYHRLEIELHDGFQDVALYQIAPAWPLELHNFHRSISDMVAQAFEVADMSEVPDKIRFEKTKKGVHRTLVYVRHPVLTGEMALSDANQFRNYLEWLDKNLTSKVDESTCLLIGFGFEHNGNSTVGAGVSFKRESFKGLEKSEFSSLAFYVLDELQKVEEFDLVEFMRVQNYQVPREIRDRLIASIIEKTNGHYQRVVAELKDTL
jgi:hypothetical protein